MRIMPWYMHFTHLLKIGFFLLNWKGRKRTTKGTKEAELHGAWAHLYHFPDSGAWAQLSNFPDNGARAHLLPPPAHSSSPLPFPDWGARAGPQRQRGLHWDPQCQRGPHWGPKWQRGPHKLPDVESKSTKLKVGGQVNWNWSNGAQIWK